MHHTNIVPVFGLFESDGLFYYAMQFIEGQGLDQVLTSLKQGQWARETWGPKETIGPRENSPPSSRMTWPRARPWPRQWLQGPPPRPQ